MANVALPADHNLAYLDGSLHLEGVDLGEIAQQYGTPTYVYSKGGIVQALENLSAAFAGVTHKIHYAVKANSSLAILDLVRQQGAGFDIVSAGELSRVLAIGGDPADVIFSGVGKSIEEIDFALKAGIACFNVESESELLRIEARAANLQRIAPIALRVNPNVDAKTHPYISTGLRDNKFGVPIEQALELYDRAAQSDALTIVGIDCHIGSQINDVQPLMDSLINMLELVDALSERGIDLEHIDLGGGMGISYEQGETPLDLEDYGSRVRQIMGARAHTLYLEPGRSITANAGLLLTRTEYLKPSAHSEAPNFAVVDAAMNDLIRPALYQARHEVIPVTAEPDNQDLRSWQIVGPICESGDFLARDRELSLTPGDLLAIASAGAYGMVQASNYNSRGRACEVLVEGEQSTLIRRRETIQDQMRLETFEKASGS